MRYNLDLEKPEAAVILRALDCLHKKLVTHPNELTVSEVDSILGAIESVRRKLGE